MAQLPAKLRIPFNFINLKEGNKAIAMIAIKAFNPSSTSNQEIRNALSSFLAILKHL